MKRILIFSGCLLLILLANLSIDKTPVSEFNHDYASELIINSSSFNQGCFASPLIWDQQTPKANNGLNIGISTFLSHHIISNSEKISSSFYIPQIVGWARWIWLLPRRRQPYRNPHRRFRLNKKQRRHLRRRLSNLLALPATNRTVDGLSSSLELV